MRNEREELRLLSAIRYHVKRELPLPTPKRTDLPVSRERRAFYQSGFTYIPIAERKSYHEEVDVSPDTKSGEIVVIPLDDELAEALGVAATGYLVARDGEHGN